MNIQNPSVAKIGFTGIYGSATMVSKEGIKKRFDINLTNENSTLEINKGFAHNNNFRCYNFPSLEKGQYALSKNDGVRNSLPVFHQGGQHHYEDIKIDKVDGNSQLIIKGEGCFDIGTLKDKARLYLSIDNGNSPTATINSVEGKNVELSVCNTSKAKINGNSQFKMPSDIAEDCKIQGNVKRNSIYKNDIMAFFKIAKTGIRNISGKDIIVKTIKSV